jgi:hypothetical protein
MDFLKKHFTIGKLTLIEAIQILKTFRNCRK